LKIGVIANCEVVLLARHGLEHTIPPSQVNYRANISALKDQGCDYLLATTAVGSLQDEIERGDLVILDQFIDFTRHRSVTFHDSFPPGEAKHTGMADPFDEQMRTILIERCEALGYHHHPKGTVVTIEGPRFSTRAESHMFRAWGADVINMSIAPECALANEAGLPYAAVAISTDYDCWKQEEEPVSWDKILEVFNQNVDRVTRLIVETVGKLNSL
jgi:5'-methylthioadenosine phosphorylase